MYSVGENREILLEFHDYALILYSNRILAILEVFIS